ncbi:hypothetical protein C8Q70DRAFT_966523 [Cubamyces menziesii]|nr:hypothetical protein C8Q70DRAFT_966523 [Cubamyces menziesii]
MGSTNRQLGHSQRIRTQRDVTHPALVLYIMGKWRSFKRFSPKKKAALGAESASTAAYPHSVRPFDPPGPSRRLEEAQSNLLECQEHLAAAHARVDTYRRDAHNSHRREARLRTANANLGGQLNQVRADKEALAMTLKTERAQLAHHVTNENLLAQDLDRALDRNQLLETRNESLLKRVQRMPAQVARKVETAVMKQVRENKTFKLKDHGVITDTSRDLIRGLTDVGVPQSNIPDAITRVVEATGMEVSGSVSTRSVGRIVVEGQVSTKLQITASVQDADGVTISSDGTTHKNVNYESRHIYTTKGPTHNRHFAGVTSAPDHSSATQMDGWMDTIQDLCDTYNASPLGQKNPVTPADFAAKIKGMNTDHAPDQKKLASLFREWKVRCERETRGQRALLDGALGEFEPFLTEEVERAIRDAGGARAWDRLSDEERTERNATAKGRAIFCFGEARFAALSDAEKREVDLFVWAGCCMHKELNSVKGGNAEMSAFWRNTALTGPMLLMNQHNAAAAAFGPSDAQVRAEAVSSSGGVKLTSLAGALFNHKDDKKGQQDTTRIFFEASEAVGAAVAFPDTSNTRYQSHCEAAAELIVHLPLYIDFLSALRDKKNNRTFNHLEENVWNGLHDIPTLTELCVLALYSQAISHPYLREVRGPDQLSANILDLGPLHDRVKAHCRRIIDNPSLLLSPETCFDTGSMDGELWERPEAIYAILRLAPSLPHLEQALVAFFRGALGTWERFTAEFTPGGQIAGLSSDEKRIAWMRTTNDDNEGGLGAFRANARRAPSMTLNQYNARTMHKVNGTAEFTKHQLDDETRAFTRKRARLIDASGLEKERRMVLAQADSRVVEEKRGKDRAKRQKEDARTALLDALVVLQDAEDIAMRAPQITNGDLDVQLDWHRRREGKETGIPVKAQLTRKAQKVEALCAAVRRYNHSLAIPEASCSIAPGGSLDEGATAREW